jgi:small subunit ribosomal protein S18
LIRNENSAPPPPGGGPGSGQGGPGGGPGDRRGGGRPRGRGRSPPRRKVCVFCVDKVTDIDYKDVNRLRRFVSDRGKIEPRRKSGTCAKHQRILATAIKRARHLALLPFTAEHVRELGGSFGPIRPERRDRFGDRGGFRGDREGGQFGQPPAATSAAPAVGAPVPAVAAAPAEVAAPAPEAAAAPVDDGPEESAPPAEE